MSEYLVGLTGESHYQRAIANCNDGEVAYLWREPGNPYDSDAVACENRFGQTIGYIPAGHFVQRVVCGERQGMSATIHALNSGPVATGVVIEVRLDGTPVPERKFRRSERVLNYRTSSTGKIKINIYTLIGLAIVILWILS